MPLSPEVQAAIERLLNYYDGDLPYDPASNPGGFRRGGNVVNFDPALKDVGIAVEAAGEQAAVVQAGVDRAERSATEAAFLADLIGSGFFEGGSIEQLPVPNITVRGADPTGGADSVSAFRNATRTTPWNVPPGQYDLATAVFAEDLRLFLSRPGVKFKNKDIFAEIYKTFLYVPGLPNVQHVIEKMRSGVPVVGACRGDSLTWGLIGDGLGDRTVDNNGYTENQPRSSITIPQALQAGLRSNYQYNSAAGSNITVRQQGYPGDRTYEMFLRWKEFDAANKLDFVQLMIGANDARSPYSMAFFILLYRMTIEQLLENGTVVIIVAPPPFPDLNGNAQIHLYREAAKHLALEYDLPFIDAAEQLRQLGTTPWAGPGDVHLTAPAYNLLGRAAVPLLSQMGGLLARRVGPGSQITAADMPGSGYGGDIVAADNVNARSGRMIVINPTFTLDVPVYVERDCLIIFETLTDSAASGQTRHLRLLVDGATVVTGNFSAPAVSGVFRRSYAGIVLKRGFRLLQLTASGSQAALLDQIRFVDPATTTIGTGGIYRNSPLAPWSRPSDFTSWCVEREAKRTNWPQRIEARLRLGPQLCGIAIIGDDVQNLPYFSNSTLAILRDGPNLLVRMISGSQTDVIAANAIGHTDEVEIDLKAEFTSPTPGMQGQLNVYLNGATQAVIIKTNPLIVGGYVSVISLPGVARLLSLRVLEG
ncbi:SGNH/GDSL hydrolase family protein [Methylorubrum extorquens]|uniref:SGNH/GDSL hydrolase family protein n=1 Tax=Methylorubrum extorquens TaxID=408 RepID=UPI0022373FEA|nr:SGNH/GDSL hydrolase family protein [Methylorubrum extorquens]UYW25650.1 SGNH/GDSL hydrolase family protein [Methylorubrum extorquens]